MRPADDSARQEDIPMDAHLDVHPPLLGLVIAVVELRQHRVRAPMCEEHRNHWLSRTLLVLACLLLVVGGLVGTVVFRGRTGLGSGYPILTWLTIAGTCQAVGIASVAINRTAIWASRVSKRGVELTGVCEEFRAAYLEQRQEQMRQEQHQEQCQLPAMPDLDKAVSEHWGEPKGRLLKLDDTNAPGSFQCGEEGSRHE